MEKKLKYTPTSYGAGQFLSFSTCPAKLHVCEHARQMNGRTGAVGNSSQTSASLSGFGKYQ